MKFRASMICAVLLTFGLQSYAQQADSASQAMLYQRLRRAGFPPGVMTRPYKPVLGGTQNQQPSNDAPGHDDSGTFMTFDVSGAGNNTFAFAINPDGAITGYSSGAGFLRSPNGTITTFHVPGDDNGTYPAAINPAGAITGQWCDVNWVCPGFLRSPAGTITIFDVPGEVGGVNPEAINPQGAITGEYFDANYVGHGFLRASDGTITTIDAPGSVYGTQAFGINPEGTVSGCYSDANFVGHGFVRASNGTLTEFDVPDSQDLSCGFDYGFFSFPVADVGINPAGAITGAYFQPIPGNPFGGNRRGFLRDKDGSFTTFDAVPSPSSPCCTWTFGIAINPAGEIAGWDNDQHDVNHGFLRAKNGTITILDAPGAGTGHNQGTLVFSISPSGQIAGIYRDANNVYHGFLWTKH